MIKEVIKAKRNGQTAICVCDNCGKEFKRQYCIVKNYKKQFCGLSCRFKNQKGKIPKQVLKYGKEHPRWKEKIIVSCSYCGKIKKVAPSLFKKRKNFFCNIECWGKWESKNRIGSNSSGWKGGKIKINCSSCGKEKLITSWQLEHFKNFFCSRKCLGEWNKIYIYGENHPSWKGGRIINTDGYIKIKLQPNSPYYSMVVTGNGYVLEHRLIMAKFLGRYLYPYEIVHHKGKGNGGLYPIGDIRNRSDNRIENLELKPTPGDHSIQMHKIYIENEKLKKELAKLKLQLA